MGGPFTAQLYRGGKKGPRIAWPWGRLQNVLPSPSQVKAACFSAGHGVNVQMPVR